MYRTLYTILTGFKAVVAHSSGLLVTLMSLTEANQEADVVEAEGTLVNVYISMHVWNISLEYVRQLVEAL